MSDYGIDRYEAESIARSEAQSAADEVGRNLGYDIDAVQDDLRRTQRELDQEREDRRRDVADLLESLDEVRRIAIGAMSGVDPGPRR